MSIVDIWVKMEDDLLSLIKERQMNFESPAKYVVAINEAQRVLLCAALESLSRKGVGLNRATREEINMMLDMLDETLEPTGINDLTS